MLVQGQIGPITSAVSLSTGVPSPARLGQLGEAIVQPLHGRYYENAYRRNQFNTFVAAQATTVGTLATYTGLVLYNPVGATVNLVPNKVGIDFSVATVAGTYGVMYGYNSGNITTLTTAQTSRNNFFGLGAAAQGLCASSIVAASAFSGVQVLGTMGSVAITSTNQIPNELFDLEGSIVLPPGAMIAIYTSAAATGYFSFQWEEVPL